MCSKEEMNLRKTLDCGQCFRWRAVEDNDFSALGAANKITPKKTQKKHSLKTEAQNKYIGVVNGRVLVAEYQENDIVLTQLNAENINNTISINKANKKQYQHQTNKIINTEKVQISGITKTQLTCSSSANPSNNSKKENEIEDFKRFATHYFALDQDYKKIDCDILREAKKHNDFFQADATTYSQGMRILRQDPFEILMSFIISANNNIPKIKLTIHDLCERFGEPLGEYGGTVYHAFPTAETLAKHADEIPSVRAIGYRAKAVKLAAEAIVNGDFNPYIYYPENSSKYFQNPLKTDNSNTDTSNTDYQNTDKSIKNKTNSPKNFCSFDEAITELKTLYGVGEKVANCIALFGMYHIEGFPVDTWVKKFLHEYYGVKKNYKDFITTRFQADAGIAQQYMFFYLRENPDALKKFYTNLK